MSEEFKKPFTVTLNLICDESASMWLVRVEDSIGKLVEKTLFNELHKAEEFADSFRL